jgi:hypothetical protein
MILKHAILTDEERDTLLRRKAEATTSDYITFETGVDPYQWVVDLHLQWEARNAKPRKTARDDEIVRLRDEEGKTFGEIGRLLLVKNPAWTGKGGKPLSRAAAEKAYHRRKGDSDK